MRTEIMFAPRHTEIGSDVRPGEERCAVATIVSTDGTRTLVHCKEPRAEHSFYCPAHRPGRRRGV